MKFIKKFNEELKPETYMSAAAKLMRMGYKKRGEDLVQHSKDIKTKQFGYQWKNLLQKFAPFGSFNLTIENTAEPSKSFTDEFALQISFNKKNLNNTIKQNWFIIQVFLIPKSEEISKKFSDMKNENIIPMLFFGINFKIEEPSFSFERIMLTFNNPLDIRFSDRASMGRFKRLLVNIFSDENFNYPYDYNDNFYNTFENFVLAELGFSSDYGLTMQMIANYINSKTVNEICAKTR